MVDKATSLSPLRVRSLINRLKTYKTFWQLESLLAFVADILINSKITVLLIILMKAALVDCLVNIFVISHTCGFMSKRYFWAVCSALTIKCNLQSEMWVYSRDNTGFNSFFKINWTCYIWLFYYGSTDKQDSFWIFSSSVNLFVFLWLISNSYNWLISYRIDPGNIRMYTILMSNLIYTPLSLMSSLRF